MNIRSVCAVAGLVCASTALAQPFTYQGKLTAAGLPAAGPHEVVSRVFAQDIGGSPLAGAGSTGVISPGPDGTFSLLVDAGPAIWTGEDRWVELSVRPLGGGAFTVLQPRQKITATPYAARALREWLVPVGSTTLATDSARTKLFINRTAGLSNTEYFGITTIGPDFTFGGMYINTVGDNGLPYYGYSTGNGLRTARTYFQGVDQVWIVDNGGDRLRVQRDGNIGIGVSMAFTKLDVGGVVRANDFAFSTPVTYVKAISGAAFQSTVSTVAPTYEVAASGTYFDASVGAAALVAPVDIPDGATITFVEFFVYDNASSQSLMCKLYRRPHRQFGSIAVGSVTTTNVNNIQNAFLTLNETISYSNNAYYLAVESSDWAGTSTSLFSVKITYTMSRPD